MYNVSEKFITAIKNNARYISAYFIYEGIKYFPRKVTIDDDIYTNDTFVGTFIAKSGTLTTNLKDNIDLEDKEISLYMGVKTGENFEYVPMGIFKIYESVSENEYKIIDYRYKFNKSFDIAQLIYPTTPLKLLTAVCEHAGVELETIVFPNKDISIPSKVFFGYETTCADVVMAVAQASCCFARITRENRLALKWFDQSEFNIEYDHQKDKNENTLTAPINTVVLAREPQNDNVYYPEVVSGDRVEFKIVNNSLLDVERYISIRPIYDRMNDFSYIPFEMKTHGYFHLDSGDVVKRQRDDGTYENLFIMNHKIEYSGGVSSSFETPALSKTQIDYKIASAIENKILNSELQVDKVKGEIKAVVSETEKLKDTTAQLVIKSDAIENTVNHTEESIYIMEMGKGNIFDDCQQSISKDINDSTSKSLTVMPLGVNKDDVIGKDICIAVDVWAKNAIPRTLSGYIGAYFTVTYEDGTVKKYSTVFVPGIRYFQYKLSNATDSMYQRIFTHHKIDDKPIRNVSNLTIEIACNGELLKVSNPKVEYGVYPTGFQFDNKAIRDNITTLDKKYTSISNTIDTLTLQAVSMTEEITTINGEVSTLTTRLNSTELKLTPTAITAMVNEKIGADGEIRTTKYILDKNGGHYYGGGLDIFNNSGERVLYADVNGNLTLKNLTAINGNFSGVVNASSIIGSTINGGSIVGVSITGSTTINVGTDLYVGNNVYIGNTSSVGKKIFGSNNAVIEFGSQTGGEYIYLHTSGYGNRAGLQLGNDVFYLNDTRGYVYALISESFTSLSNFRAEGNAYVTGNLEVNKNLTVFGTKNRLIKDDIQGNILMNAVESTVPVFEDFGTCKLDLNGKCVIRLEKRFLATVNATEQYFVFLSKMGEGDVFVKSKYNFAFIVQGTPELKFDWRVTAKQKGYENVRMDEFKRRSYEK